MGLKIEEPSFNDDTFEIKDNADSTKVAKFQCSGITTATTRTITLPDNDGTLALTLDTFNPGTKTVGTGGDYATVNDASVAGEYDLRFVSNVTETVSTTPDNVDYKIDLGPFDWTFNSTIGMSSASYASNFTVIMNGGTLTYDDPNAATDPLFELQGAGANFYLLGHGVIDNNSSAATTHLVEETCNQYYKGVFEFQLPDADDGGIRAFGSAVFIEIENMHFVGGGTSCSRGLNVDLCDQGEFGIIRASGTWSTSTNGVTFSPSIQATCDQLLFDTANAIVVNLFAATIKNLHVIAATGSITIRESNILSGNLAAAGSVVLNQEARVAGSNFNWANITATGIDIRLIDCEGSGNLSFGSARGILRGCKGIGTLTLTTAADQCKITENDLTTITIDSGCTEATLTGNTWDTTPTDNGTRTRYSGNTLVGTGLDPVEIPTFDATAKVASFTAVSNKIYKVDVSSASVICTMPEASLSNDGDVIKLYLTVSDVTNTLTFAAGTGSTLQTLNNAAISVGSIEGTAIDWISDGTDWYCMNVYE